MRDTFWKVIVTVALIVVLTFGAGLFIVQGVKNTAISYEEQVAAAQSDIQVQEKRRSDLIPNLVETVKAYDKHEYDTLMAVIAARGSSSDAAVSEITTQIAAVAEAYPELQSADNYRELMNELAVTGMRCIRSFWKPLKSTRWTCLLCSCPVSPSPVSIR